MKRLRVVILVALAALLGPGRSAFGQKSQSTGFFVGLGLEGNGITTNNNGTVTESGSGAGLVLGYGFTNLWSLYAEGSGASINADGGGSYTLTHVDLGARLHFRSGPNVVVPFLQFGVSGRAVSEESNGSTVTGSGGGVSVGAGLNAHFTPRVAFSTAVTWSFGSFDKFVVDNVSTNALSVSATSARIHLGLVWFP